MLLSFFFFNDTATTEIYTLSLHDALPISNNRGPNPMENTSTRTPHIRATMKCPHSCTRMRSEEHTSELQSPDHLVCRLLLEKKKDATESQTNTPELAPLSPKTMHAISIGIVSAVSVPTICLLEIYS